jgi:glycosyltransferase involved in cell wall biosynthesis
VAKLTSAVHFTPFGELSGAQRSLLVLVEEQARSGQAAVWVPFESGVSRRAREVGAEVVCYQLRLGLRGLARTLLPAAVRLRLLAARCSARILHCHTAYGMRWATPAAKAAGLKLVCHQRDLYEAGDYHRGLEHADWIIANSGSVFESLPRALQDKTTVVHNATALPAARPEQPFAEVLQFGMAGRSVPEKGMALFLEAVLPLVEQGVGEAHIWGLWSMGPSCPVSEALVKRVASLPEAVRARVHLEPFREDTDRFFAAMDVVVVPSVQPEPFGRMAIEAMAWGCAVVVASHGGLREIVDDGATGLWFAPGDLLDLRGALWRLLREGDLRRALGEAGRQAVEARFSPQAHAQRVEAVYQRVLAP